MIDTKNAKKRLEDKFPDREVKAISEYKGKYLLAAPGKELGAEDTTDAFYLMDKESGEITSMVPAMDIVGFQMAIGKPIETF